MLQYAVTRKMTNCCEKHRNESILYFHLGFDDQVVHLEKNTQENPNSCQPLLRAQNLQSGDCAMSLESLLPIRHHSPGKKIPFPFLHFTFSPYPLPMKWLAALVKSATQSPITWKGCEVYESDYGPIFPEIRTLSPGSSGPHEASQAWPQTRVVFSLLSLLIVVKQPHRMRAK